MEELVTAPGGLLSQEVLEHHATSYGALPRTKQDPPSLILTSVEAEHPTASEQITNFVFS
jgi:hypothetical protein